MEHFMWKLSEQFKTPSLDSLYCEVSQGKFQPFIQPTEANAVRKHCGGFGNEVVTCKHPSLRLFLKEIDGLDLLNIKNENPLRSRLPKYIPIIDGEFFSCHSGVIKYNTVAVSLEDIFTSQPRKYAGRIHVGKLKIKRDFLESPIFQNKKVILFSSGRDALIEKVWQESEILHFFSELAKMGFTLITGMNFSVFVGECPVGQAINMKKSLKYFSLLQKAGIPAIPHIYWAHELHLRRWVKWLKKNPKTNLITINCQMNKTLESCRIIWEGIQYLIKHTGNNVRFLLEGPKKKILTELSNYSPLIHVAIKEPSMISKFHRKYILYQDGLKRIREKDTSKCRLLGLNLKTYDYYLQKIFKKREYQEK